MKKAHSKIIQEMAQFASSDSVPAESLRPAMVAALEWLVIFGYLDASKIGSWPSNGLVPDGGSLSLQISAKDYVTLDQMTMDLREMVQGRVGPEALRGVLHALLEAMVGVEIVEPTWSDPEPPEAA